MQGTFFTERAPADGALIFVGQSRRGGPAELPTGPALGRAVGRWLAGPALVVLHDLRAVCIRGQAGWFWAPADGHQLLPAEAVPAESN
jgi:hypothetical protein